MAKRICSAWDWDNLRYDYYHCPGEMSLGGWRPMTGMGLSKRGQTRGVGIDIEDALPPLPQGSKWAGTGTQARGTVVRPVKKYAYLHGTSGLGAVDVNMETAKAAGTKVLEYGQQKFDWARAKWGAKVVTGFLLGLNLGRKAPKFAGGLSMLAGLVLVGEQYRKSKAMLEQGEVPKLIWED